MPALFKSSLEADILTSMLQAFQDALTRDPHQKAVVLEYLVQLGRTARFDTVTLFLSEGEKKVARAVWQGVGEDPRPHGWKI
jgi:hypothetical protein